MSIRGGFVRRKLRAARRKGSAVARSVPAWWSYRKRGGAALGLELPEGVRLSRRDIELVLDPWYHDFGVLGVPTRQLGGHFGPNQLAKQDILFDLVRQGLRHAGAPERPVRTVELFCAEGFYGNYAVRAGAASSLGIDHNPLHLEKARLITRLLGNQERVSFRRDDVFRLEGSWELGLCFGGLYHIADPWGLLRLLRGRVTGALVIQTVYTLARSEPDYFETPAPGWTWGCRFSLEQLRRRLREAGWEILEERVNELPGNDRPEDRGSAYLLCAPA